MTSGLVGSNAASRRPGDDDDRLTAFSWAFS
jgi:hypothetical protein